MLLAAVSVAYACGIAIRNLCYDKRWLKSCAANAPVISIGNVTTGGTGKTPLVVWLCEMLGKSDHKCAVLTRGYKSEKGKLTDESAPIAPANERAKRRVSDEQLLLDYGSQHDCEIVILRVPGIYGPGRVGIERIKGGSPFIDEVEAYPGNRIHVEDLLRCCIAALRPETPAGIYNVGDGDNRSSTAFASRVAELAGIPLPPTISRAKANETFSELALSFLRESRILDITKMRAVMGVVPRYGDADDGIRASLLEDGLLRGRSENDQREKP